MSRARSPRPRGRCRRAFGSALTANLPARPASEPCNRRTGARRPGMAQFGPMPKPNQAVGLLVCVAVLALGASSAAAAERIPGIDVSRASTRRSTGSA